MPEILELCPENFSSMSWLRFKTFSFAANLQIAQIGMNELAAATLEYPLFVSLVDNQYRTYALLGQKPDCNGYLTGNGHWIAEHKPASLQIYPFTIIEDPINPRIGVVNDTNFLRSDDSGEAFYLEGGEKAPFVANVERQIEHLIVERERMAKVCGVLDQHGLLSPWQPELPGCIELASQLHLRKLNAPQMRKISSVAIKELHQSGAGLLAHCLLLSAQHSNRLAKRHEQQRATGQLQSESKQQNPPLDPTLSDGDSIDFSSF